jgi:hypothetical protein
MTLNPRVAASMEFASPLKKSTRSTTQKCRYWTFGAALDASGRDANQLIQISSDTTGQIHGRLWGILVALVGTFKTI